MCKCVSVASEMQAHADTDKKMIYPYVYVIMCVSLMQMHIYGPVCALFIVDVFAWLNRK